MGNKIEKQDTRRYVYDSSGNRVCRQYKGANVRQNLRWAINFRDGLLCWICGSDLSKVEPFFRTLDHLIPISAGGTNDPSNLACACRSCNSQRKTETTPEQKIKIQEIVERSSVIEMKFYRSMAKEYLAK